MMYKLDIILYLYGSFNTDNGMKIDSKVIFVSVLSICVCIKTELLATLKMCVLHALTEVAINEHCRGLSLWTFSDPIKG
jgi:hypothetical protein